MEVIVIKQMYPSTIKINTFNMKIEKYMTTDQL